MSVKERNRGFEYLRAIACVCIILSHSTYSTMLMYSSQFTAAKTLIAQSLVYNLKWCVPCFIMTTGALLLAPEKEISYATLFKKYIARMVKAIFVFGIIFLLCVMAFNPARRTLSYFLQGLYRIFAGDTWSHMWYLYCLVGLYLLLPFYKKITAQSGEKEIRYLLIVYIIFRGLLVQLNAFGISSGFYIHESTIYPFWLFMGYYLYRWGMGRSRLMYGLLALISTVCLVVCTWVRLHWNLTAMDSMFEHYSIFVVLQAIGAAGWFFQCKNEGFPRLKKVLSNIDRHSFGIYLMHLMFVRLLFKHIHFNPLSFGSAWFLGVLVVVAVAFVCSYILDWLLKKLPLFRSIL